MTKSSRVTLLMLTDLLPCASWLLCMVSDRKEFWKIGCHASSYIKKSDRRKTLSVIYTGIQCNRIICFIDRENNGWDMPDQQDWYIEKAIKSNQLWSSLYVLLSDNTGLESWGISSPELHWGSGACCLFCTKLSGAGEVSFQLARSALFFCHLKHCIRCKFYDFKEHISVPNFSIHYPSFSIWRWTSTTASYSSHKFSYIE